MMRLLHAVSILAAALCALAAARPHARAVAAPAATPVTVALSIGGKAYTAKGSGECTYAPVASIYGVRAEQWRVDLSQNGAGLRNVGLTVWRPAAGGADQLTFYAQVGTKSHRIDTVKGSQKVGSGAVTVQPKGMGGRFEVNGKDAGGAAVRGTVECARFSAPDAVAG